MCLGQTRKERDSARTHREQQRTTGCLAVVAVVVVLVWFIVHSFSRFVHSVVQSLRLLATESVCRSVSLPLSLLLSRCQHG